MSLTLLNLQTRRARAARIVQLHAMRLQSQRVGRIRESTRLAEEHGCKGAEAQRQKDEHYANLDARWMLTYQRA